MAKPVLLCSLTFAQTDTATLKQGLRDSGLVNGKTHDLLDSLSWRSHVVVYELIEHDRGYNGRTVPLKRLGNEATPAWERRVVETLAERCMMYAGRKNPVEVGLTLRDSLRPY
jgi:hypothetical protein